MKKLMQDVHPVLSSHPSIHPSCIHFGATHSTHNYYHTSSEIQHVQHHPPHLSSIKKNLNFVSTFLIKFLLLRTFPFNQKVMFKIPLLILIFEVWFNHSSCLFSQLSSKENKRLHHLLLCTQERVPDLPVPTHPDLHVNNLLRIHRLNVQLPQSP